MRASQRDELCKKLQRAIDAITVEREIAEEFEKEFKRRAALPEGTAPKTELEALPRKYHKQVVRGMLGQPPKQKEAMQQYRIREKLRMRHPEITRPPIENAYPWRHPVARAAQELADCSWTTEAKAIAEELNGLPTGATGWLHLEMRDRQLDDIRARADRVLRILTTCLEEAAPSVEPQPPAATKTEPNPDPPPEERFVFAHGGCVYHIEGFGERGDVSNHLKGFQQIHRLIQTPGNVVTYLELDGVDGNKQIALDAQSHQPPLDAEAQQNLWNEYNRLQAEAEKAEDKQGETFNNVDAKHCRDAMDKITSTLMSAKGIGGKDRDLNSKSDKLRPKIADTLKTAYEKLRCAKPPMEKLADHFQSSIAGDGTGTGYIYEPPPDSDPQWSVERQV